MQIALEVMRVKTSIAELCNKYKIVQSQYYKWCDLLLSGADRIFVPDPDKKNRHKHENTQLKTNIEELTVELNRIAATMKRARFKTGIDSDKPIIAGIINIKSEHTLLGYRRVWAYMRYRQGISVGGTEYTV